MTSSNGIWSFTLTLTGQAMKRIVKVFLDMLSFLWAFRFSGSQSLRVTLSSSEEEYFAMSEAVKEVRFNVLVLESLRIKVETPIIVKVDNVGAIFMAENVSAMSRTKHIDTRYHFL
jgi:hypothetical protein